MIYVEVKASALQNAEAQIGANTEGTQSREYPGKHGQPLVSAVPLDVVPAKTDLALRGRPI